VLVTDEVRGAAQVVIQELLEEQDCQAPTVGTARRSYNGRTTEPGRSRDAGPVAR
jgi:hypothetical protein